MPNVKKINQKKFEETFVGQVVLVCLGTILFFLLMMI